MDFLVERPLREVLDRAETYMWLEGFHVSLSKRTETTSLFSRVYVPKKGVLWDAAKRFRRGSSPGAEDKTISL
jgi:hypothetical protein